MADVLDQIIAHKKTEVAAAKKQRPLEAVKALAMSAPPARDFYAALAPAATPRIIAECKRQSPSRGVMVKDYDPVRIAVAYQRGGAAAISVLTDETFFGGKLADLTAVADAVAIPALRKDFIIDEYQIYEARAAHADTFLLLAGVLDTSQLEQLLRVGRSLGMEPLIESHSERELDMALATTGRILGINNRDLQTFSVDLAVSRALVEKARQGGPSNVTDRIVVCESGIKGRNDVETMQRAGFGAFLVGEALVTSKNPEDALSALLK